MILGNIFSGFGNNITSGFTNNNPNANIIQKFAEFKKTMEGKDPEKIVRQLMSEGKMSQQQFESLKQQATNLMSILR